MPRTKEKIIRTFFENSPVEFEQIRIEKTNSEKKEKVEQQAEVKSMRREKSSKR